MPVNVFPTGVEYFRILPEMILTIAGVMVMFMEAIFTNEEAAWTDSTDLERFKELDPDHPEISFSNRRKVKAQFYVFRKIR